MKYITIMAACIGLLVLSGCQDDATVATRNVSKAADNFEVDRRIVFYNGITDTYMLTIEGKCSIDDQGNQLEVICKVGKNRYKKHFLGLSDNLSYMAEHLEPTTASAYHSRITFKPQSIIPDIDFRASGEELITNHSEANQ